MSTKSFSEYLEANAQAPLAHRNAMLTATVGLNLLGLAMPVVILQVFERIVPSQGYETLLVLSVMLGVVFLMELVFRLARANLQSDAGRLYETQLFGRVYHAMVRAVPAAFAKSGSGVHLDRVNAVNTIREHVAGQRPLVVVDIVFAGLFTASIWVIGGPLALVPLCFIGVVLFLGLGLQRAHRFFLSARQSVDGRRYSFLIEFLNGIRTIRTHAMEAQMLRRYEMLAAQSKKASFQLIGFSEMSRSISSVLGQTSVAAMALGGSFLVIDGRIGMGTLAACMLLNGRISQPVLKLFTLWAQSESVEQANQKLAEVMEMPKRPEGRADYTQLIGRLTFRQAALAGKSGATANVADLDGQFAAGDIVNVEQSDRGQASALFATILGERSPFSGNVDIDGWTSARLATIRGPGGTVYIGDDAMIFHGSILENITLFGRLPAHEGALDIARRVALEETVRTLPMGYETLVGSEGSHHSRGFLQLVALTRALAMEPKVLIVNNALSALDEAHRVGVAGLLREQASERLTLLRSEQPQFRAIATRHLRLRSRADEQASTYDAWDSDRAADAAVAERFRKGAA